MAQPEALTEFREPQQPGNPLAEIIEREISETGPIPFDRYMSVWLYGARDGLKEDGGKLIPGYYTGNDVTLGYEPGTNDFRTPPEYTPLYGYAFARQLTEMWRNLDRPDDFTIVEMGGGAGTLANDILTGLKIIQDESDEPVFDNTQYIILERGQRLAQQQHAKLAGFRDKAQILQATAYEGPESPLQNITGVVLSTELPDAFPVKMVKREGDQIQEMYIDQGDSDEFEIQWQDLSPDAQKYLDIYDPQIDEGRPYPINIPSIGWMERISEMMERGYVITVDYPSWPKKDPPIRIYAKDGVIEVIDDMKRIDGFLEKRYVGRTDITTGVDFQVLSDAGNNYGLKTEGFVDQRGFLYGLGFDLILKEIKKNHVPDASEFSFKGLTGDIEGAEQLYKHLGWNVLMHSKGVEAKQKLGGARFVFSFEDHFENPPIRLIEY